MSKLQDFLTLSYSELEEKNLEAKDQRMKRVPVEQIREERLKYLTDEKRIKAVTVMFSDLVCRLLLEKKKTEISRSGVTEFGEMVCVSVPIMRDNYYVSRAVLHSL